MNKYLKGIKESDNKIINEIYQKNFPQLKYFISNNNGNEADAKDVFQEALVATFRRLERGDFEIKTTFGTYIFQVGKFIWFKKIRGKKPTQSTEDVQIADQGILEEVLFKEDRYSFFQSMLKKMGSDCQTLLNYFFEKKSYKEIVTLMDFNSVDYAKRKKMLCKNKLVSLIKEDPRFRDFYN